MMRHDKHFIHTDGRYNFGGGCGTALDVPPAIGHERIGHPPGRIIGHPPGRIIGHPSGRII